MKLSTEWKTLTRDQRRAWNAWAKNNKVLLDDGVLRYVSGHEAMTMVLRNPALAGDAPNPSIVPAAVAWLDGALGMNDAGPFTENTGFIGFRANQAIAAGTKWFVWATPPVGADEGLLISCLKGIFAAASMPGNKLGIASETSAGQSAATPLNECAFELRRFQERKET